MSNAGLNSSVVGGGFQTSLDQINAILNNVTQGAGNLAAGVLKVKQTIDQIRGQDENKTSAELATEGYLFNTDTVSPQLQNLLMIAGLVAAGVGIVYLLRK